MIEGSIKKDLILNGSNSIAAFKEDGAIYRVNPIPIIQEVSLYNLVKNKTKIFRLGDRLTRDYEILGITADIPDDDENESTPDDDAGEQPKVRVGIRLYSGVKSTRNIKLELTSYPFYINKLFINHRDTWHMKTDRDVTSITFMCKPMYLEQPIIFT